MHLVEASGDGGAQVLEDGRIHVLNGRPPVSAGTYIAVLLSSIQFYPNVVFILACLVNAELLCGTFTCTGASCTTEGNAVSQPPGAL